jgi:hypothetical protein
VAEADQSVFRIDIRRFDNERVAQGSLSESRRGGLLAVVGELHV